MSLLEVRKIEGRILIVDDEPANVRLLRRMLGCAGCTDVFSTSDPREAVALSISCVPDAILLDLNMPFLDGITLLGHLTEQYPCRITMPILVLTADSSVETRRLALQSGASDFLTKPLDAVEVALRIGNHLRCRTLHLQSLENNAILEARVKARISDLEDAQAEILVRLSEATESRDDQTAGHVERMASMAAEIAVEMGICPAEVELLRRAARLHDIGKVSVPDSILLKSGKLTDSEFAIMREHAARGAHVLRGSRLPVLICAEHIAHFHHERWDGNGYPEGLAGSAIPMCARIAAVADVFDALTSDRPYKDAWCLEAAWAEIHRTCGSHFDPRVVEAFDRVINRRIAVASDDSKRAA
jgi:putative two-component system response regulator